MTRLLIILLQLVLNQLCQRLIQVLWTRQLEINISSSEMLYLGRIDDIVRIKLRGDVLKSADAKSTLIARARFNLKPLIKYS